MRLASLGCLAVVGCGRVAFDPLTDASAPVDTRTAYDGANRIFATQASWTGALGGLAGADETCAATAAQAGLVGDFVALLNTDMMPVGQRLSGSRGWVDLAGTPIADLSSDFDMNRTLYPIRVDQAGAVVTVPLWFGGPTTTHCDNWTNGTAARSGIVVMPTSSLAWSTPRNGSCVQQFHLICAERGRVVPVPPPAETGRIAFVTETLWFGNDGLAGADALCATEATAAGLPGTFRAWLGSSAGGPDARFSTTGEPWRRVDGPRLAPTAAAFLTGDPLTTFANRTAQGAVVSTNTWTGADGQHCSDWTGAGNGTVGNPGSIGSERRAAFAQLCGLPNAVLCLEL